MPLGNYTSQFFANVYLSELDYFVKHFLKAKYYIRYVDDFVILHRRKKLLEYYKNRIEQYLLCLKLELHPEKSKISPLCNGVDFVGYKIFYHYKRVRKRNMKKFKKKFENKLELYKNGEITREMLIESLQGWFGYARWANTHKFRQKILMKIEEIKKAKPNVSLQLH
jgi:RNA-directed DNA polymerase